MRLLHVVTAALLAFAGGAVVTPGHAAAPPLSARGVLGAETTLTWSGAAAIRLDVPKATQYRDGDVDLWVSGATYAFVRFVGPAHPDCPQSVGPRCIQDRVNWLAAVHGDGGYLTGPVSRRHEAAFGEPPLIMAPRLDVYLFTDGKATLRIRTTSLRGRTAYRPGARLHGKAVEIPQTCVPLGCADQTGRSNGYTHGGMTFDLRGAGWADFYAINRADDRGTLPTNGNQARAVTGCLFPNGDDPEASARAADHPRGCDDAGGTTDATVRTAGHAFNLGSHVVVGGATSINMLWSGARGPQYIGFQGLSAGPGPSRALAYGIWFRYLP